PARPDPDRTRPDRRVPAHAVPGRPGRGQAAVPRRGERDRHADADRGEAGPGRCHAADLLPRPSRRRFPVKQYMLSVHSVEGSEPPPPEAAQKMYEDTAAFNAELQSAGAWV